MADESSYNSCDFTGATLVGSTSAGGGDGLSVPISTTGFHYYACQVGSHCSSGGQKLSVSAATSSNVMDTSSATRTLPLAGSFLLILAALCLSYAH